MWFWSCKRVDIVQNNLYIIDSQRFGRMIKHPRCAWYSRVLHRLCSGRRHHWFIYFSFLPVVYYLQFVGQNGRQHQDPTCHPCWDSNSQCEWLKQQSIRRNFFRAGYVIAKQKLYTNKLIMNKNNYHLQAMTYQMKTQVLLKRQPTYSYIRWHPKMKTMKLLNLE
jgi:hypothetical protein